MRHPWANIVLLFLLAVQLVSGFFGFLNGVERNQWILWLHGIGAYAITVLLLWKSAIILDVYRRRTGLSWRRLLFAFTAVILTATLISGLAWTIDGPRFLFGFSLVTLHILLALALAPLVAWHAWQLRWILHVPRAMDRRSFLRTSGLGLAGLIIWRGIDRAKDVLALAGAGRRFTGSYETGSFSGVFPSVSWIADRPPPIDVFRWRLLVDGAVQRPLSLDYDEVVKLADGELTTVLDCTGGWYTEQVWRGVRLSKLLDIAGLKPGAMSVTVEAVSGYKRRFSLGKARSYLLATEVAGSPITHGHGFPLRLVAPDQRGVNWVKWTSRIQVNKSSHYWQLPLPLQ